MIVSKALKDDLVKQVKSLEGDLRSQVETVPEVFDRLRGEYDRAFKLGRTAATWASWRDERVTQAAAAWVLGTVFVRFCEDNGLLTQPYLAGPDHDRMILAEEAQDEFFRANPAETDRGWLLAAFAEIGRSQAGHLLFDERHNPLFQIPLSHDAAKGLIAFWRRRAESGGLVHVFDTEEWDTRFLGDLYQDLSAAARKTYALLQTPEFVEEFILDYTLKPAIEEFGHDKVLMIDPTCGSGHFVLGAFHRLLAEWDEQAPSRDRRERVRLALSAVHGVDLNPFAVAISRFRLFIAAVRASGFTTLIEVEQYELPLNLAIGDALIKHRQQSIPGIDQDDALADFHYAPEDVQDFPGILDEGRYHVVVGNPPYITVKDKNLNKLYRDLYDAAAGRYALSVPFAQRFFRLSRVASADGRGAGHVGQITGSSFMKQGFGQKLIEQFLRSEVELTRVVDTSGAYIPGHGTPTVILIGRNKSYRQTRSDTVRTVMGIRGEPAVPKDPSKGKVWLAIVNQADRPDSESEWILVQDLARDLIVKYPMSLTGGGARDLVQRLGLAGSSRLSGHLDGSIGFAGFSAVDEAFYFSSDWHVRRGTPAHLVHPLVKAKDISSWGAYQELLAIAPYGENGSLLQIDTSQPWAQQIWMAKQALEALTGFSGEPRSQRGIPWWSWYQWSSSRNQDGLRIGLGKIGTHNDAFLNASNAVTNQHVLVLSLGSSADENSYLGLLGMLNSSTACFWLKQVSHGKGNGGINGGIASEDWERFYEFTGTKLQDFPLPKRLPLERSRELDGLAECLKAVSPSSVARRAVPSREVLRRAREQWHSTRGAMITVQEELDWEVYSLYRLLEEGLTVPAHTVPELKLGERAFEIVLARKMAAAEAETQWFARHNSTPITELPGHWSAEYRAVVEKRIALIESDRNIGLIERPECKRRWATEGFDAMQEKALRNWLLDRFEARELWFHQVDGMEQPRLLTTAELADALRRDADTLEVADLYAPGRDLEKVVAELVTDEHVPYLAALRYKPSGIEKRKDWEDVWDRQREEDAAESEQTKKKIRDLIPVPPKYGPGDFLKSSYWGNRGKLDVPKERFISYPYASRDGALNINDGALLLGWAGFDHREQAQALAMLLVEREQNDGWGRDRLQPMLAGLREVLPWVRQWHGEFDVNYGGSPAEVYEGFLDQSAGRLGLTHDDLAGWRPPATRRGRTAGKKKQES